MIARPLLDWQKAELERMAQVFQKETGVTLRELQGPLRHAAVSVPRQDFMLRLLRERWSLTDIGIALNRNHATVLYGVNQARAREAQRRQLKSKTAP